MDTRTLGKSCLSVSLVGLGCNNFGGRANADDSRKVIEKALELGITLFDTADIYGENGGSETILGHVLGARRKDIVLATKFGMPMDEGGKRTGASRRYIMSAVEDSLRRLQADWIDLYQLHQPDPRTPIEETLRALDDLVHHGKVRYIGCSNLPAWQVAGALWTSKHHGLNSFICCQDEYSLLVREPERELLPAIGAYGIGLLPFFPLASGLLTGKYKPDQMPPGARLTMSNSLAKRYLTDENWTRVNRLLEFSVQRGHTLLDLAFSWLAAHPAVSSVIAGATRPEQLEQNVKAAGWALTAEDMTEIDRLTK